MYIFTSNFFKKFVHEYHIRVSNRLDPDQTRHIVGPDLGLNCLQRLSADDTSKQKAGEYLITKLA